MILSEGEKLVMVAALKWAAMEYGKTAKHFLSIHNQAEAMRSAHFSMECARIAEMLDKAK